MITKQVKANPTTRYKLQNDYQKDRQRRKKLKILISTTIFLLVYGVFLKGTFAEDGNSTKSSLDPTSNKSDADPPAERIGTTGAPANNQTNSTEPEPEPSFTSDSGNDGYDEVADIAAVVHVTRNNTQGGTGNSTGPFRPDRQGDGTEHEQAGVPHYRPIDITPFVPSANFTNPAPKYRYGMDPIFKMSNSILNVMAPDDTFPEGYVEIRDDKNFYLGRRVQNNDWLPLLNRYLLVWLIVALFLLLIIVIPFIAVCYCCFCCHKRCGRHCPPCDEEPDERRRCYYGILLFLLIIGLLFGIIIAFATNRLLEHGFAESTRNIGRSSDDTCRFLTNTNNHIKHLYINNYQEMMTQLTEQMENGHRHITLDLADVSKGQSLLELYRILSNMPKALKWMIEVDAHVKEAQFYASQLRDGLRGAKRDMLYLRNMCGYHCNELFRNHNIHEMDLGCLHYDSVPNTTIYIEAIKDIIKSDLIQIVLYALEKLKGVDDAVKKLHDEIVPLFVGALSSGSAIMTREAESISLLVDRVISDIHLKTMHTTHSFDDIYSKLGAYRNLTNVILCIVLLIILICLTIGLCYGCFAKRRRGYREDCCNKGTGATCLLIAMLLIFLTISIIALIGLFYFVFGFLAYHGACAPLRDTTSNNIFNSFDSLIDFYKLLPPAKTGNTDEDNTENPLPPLRFSNAINACRSNETIFDILKDNQFFSIRNLELLRIYKNVSKHAEDMPKVPETLKDFELISYDDMVKLEKMRTGNLSTYHSRVYTREMCKPAPTNFMITAFIPAVNHLIKDKLIQGIHGYQNTVGQLGEIESKMQRPLYAILNLLYSKLYDIDKAILIGLMNFNETIDSLLKDIKFAEKFVQEYGDRFIHELTTNLTRYVVREFAKYRNLVINETKFNIGHCKPLAYIYENGVDFVCNRMVDPMNGFWMGVLLCCLLFLPVLWVAHKLQCLYKKVGLYGPPVAIAGCPECTGATGPIKPTTVMICSGGLGSKKCPCPILSQNVPKSGDCSCSSEAIKDPRSPLNNENVEIISEWGNFFDVEAQQRIVFHGSSHAFPKTKID